jgi:hypothetical protein
MKRSSIAALCAAGTLLSSAGAFADGPILITHEKALAGGVTPGDAPGYPVTITQSGSYRLASILRPGTDKVAIQVEIANVTIDLNGFALLGRDIASRGILRTSEGRNVTVRNGVVSGFKSEGIYGGTAWTVENMQLTHNGGAGVAVGNYSRVLNSTVSENGANGVSCAYACLVQGNVIAENGGNGVDIFYSATILGNTIIGNDGYGIIAQTSLGYRTGYGNNTIDSNNAGSVYGGSALIVLHPNACDPACP